MARISRAASLDELVQAAVAPVVQRLASAIAKYIAELTAQQLEAELARKRGRAVHATSTQGARRRTAEMTKWVADVRARRVPKFVIEATGLDTKKKIVAKYGPDAAFEKGKPLPPEAKASPEKAKAPTIRKHGKAAA